MCIWNEIGMEWAGDVEMRQFFSKIIIDPPLPDAELPLAFKFFFASTMGAWWVIKANSKSVGYP